MLRTLMILFISTSLLSGCFQQAKPSQAAQERYSRVSLAPLNREKTSYRCNFSPKQIEKIINFINQKITSTSFWIPWSSQEFRVVYDNFKYYIRIDPNPKDWYMIYFGDRYIGFYNSPDGIIDDYKYVLVGYMSEQEEQELLQLLHAHDPSPQFTCKR